jgi:PAS domain S-box-containing protein
MRGESIGRAAAGSSAELEGSRADSTSDDFAALLAAVDDWVFVLREMRIVRASAVACRKLGLESTDGLEFASLWCEQQQRELETTLAALRGKSGRSDRISLETRGTPRFRVDVRLTAGMFRGEPAVFAVGRELGQFPEDASFRSAQAVLSNVEQKYRSLFEHSQFSMAITDDQARFHEVNPAFERVFGWSKAEATGRSPNDLGLVPEDIQRQTIHEIELSGAQLTTIGFTRRDGAPRMALHSSSRVVLDGVPLNFTVALDVTDYLAVQQELRDHDRQFRALFDNVNDGMFFAGKGGRFYEVNAAACEQLGYTREELLQLTVAQVSTRAGFNFDEFSKRFETVDHLSYETEHRRKDGSSMPVELTLTRMEWKGVPMVVGISRDLTQRNRIRNELREARDRLQATLRALPDLAFEFDANGVVQDYFDSRSDLLTMPPDEFLGRKIADVTEPEVGQIVLDAMRTALEKGQSSGARYFVKGRWFEMTVARRNDLDPSQTPRVIAIARDITDRKLREEELERKNDELMRFTYTVSHDLKSPLVTIKSFLGYLLQDIDANDRERVRTDVGFIEKAADRMDELLDDLLELSRIGRKVSPPERLSLRQLCTEACELLAGRIKSCDAEVVPPARDVFLWGDRVRLREVLQNLLDNALKFSKSQQPVRVFVETAPRGESEWIVSVRDRGIGIDPRYHHKLFGLFEKLHTGEGTGIGLALVKRIIEVHGGRVWLESEGEGRGTTVSFTLPNTEPEVVHE